MPMDDELRLQLKRLEERICYLEAKVESLDQDDNEILVRLNDVASNLNDLFGSTTSITTTTYGRL